MEGDSPTGNNDDGSTREILASPSFGANIQEISDRRGCSAGNCHGSATSGALTLTSGASHGNLVGVTSSLESPTIRVVAGDAVNSYLVMKLEGTQSGGLQMPRGLGALDNIDLTNIKNWIDNGAANN